MSDFDIEKLQREISEGIEEIKQVIPGNSVEKDNLSAIINKYEMLQQKLKQGDNPRLIAKHLHNLSQVSRKAQGKAKK